MQGPTGQLRRWRARGDRLRVLPAALGALAVGIGLLWAPGPAPVSLRAAVAGVWLAWVVGRAWLRRPSLPGLARRIDVASGTDGLLETALAVERGQAHGDAGLQGSVLEAAAVAVPRVAHHAGVRLHWPWASWALGIGLVVAGALVPERHASPVAVRVRSLGGLETGVAPLPGPSAGDAGRVEPVGAVARASQAGGRGSTKSGQARALRAGAAAGGGASDGTTTAGVLGGGAGGEEAGESGGGRPELTRPERPAAASDQLVSRPGTGRGDADGGAPIEGGNQGAFDVGGIDEDDPTNPDAEMPWSGGEASGKEGGPEADGDTPPGETPNGAASGGGEGERREGTGAGEAGAPGDPADGGPAPKGGEDARSKDDSQTTGPGAGAGADAVGTADAEGDGPLAPPSLPDALARIEVAWERGGDGALREVEQAALGQRSSQAWRALHADYTAVAEDTLAREAVPPARAEAVRRYFDALSADGAKDEE